MQITYDVKLPDKKGFTGKGEEIRAVETFIQGTQKTMCFTYDDEKTAKAKLATLRSWYKRNTELASLIEYFRDGSRIYFARLSPKEVKERKAALTVAANRSE